MKLTLNIAGVTASQLLALYDHINHANRTCWKPEWLHSEVGHTWQEEDTWSVLRDKTSMTLVSGETSTFDMLGFMDFIGINTGKVRRDE